MLFLRFNVMHEEAGRSQDHLRTFLTFLLEKYDPFLLHKFECNHLILEMPGFCFTECRKTEDHTSTPLQRFILWLQSCVKDSSETNNNTNFTAQTWLTVQPPLSFMHNWNEERQPRKPKTSTIYRHYGFMGLVNLMALKVKV
jgi:hypothetical protein